VLIRTTEISLSESKYRVPFATVFISYKCRGPLFIKEPGGDPTESTRDPAESKCRGPMRIKRPGPYRIEIPGRVAFRIRLGYLCAGRGRAQLKMSMISPMKAPRGH